MLFHPVTLRSLYEWKTSARDDVPLDLLALVVSYKQRINYEELDTVLYQYKETTVRKNKRLERLKTVIQSKFTFGPDIEGGDGDAGVSVYSLCNTSEVSGKTLELLRAEGERLRKTWRIGGKKDGVASEDGGSKGTGERTRTQGLSDTNILRFVRVENKKEKTESTRIGPFVPMWFDDATTVSSMRIPARNSIRVRRDLQDPRKLVFIKFSDQPRPPIYRFRTEDVRTRNSMARLPQVLDYDQESEWGDEEEADSIGSTEDDSGDAEESSHEWIDSDVENIELARSNKKPSLTFPSCKFHVVTPLLEPWLQLPLTERSVFPEEHLAALREGVSMADDATGFTKRFCRRYVIKYSAASKKLREVGVFVGDLQEKERDCAD